MNTLRQPLLRELTTALLVALLLLQSATAVAPGPAWWGAQNVTDPAAVPDDFAVANIGQLKHMARKAMQAMDADLPGGAGAAIHALVDPWGDTVETASKPDNGLAINQGQLKHVAAPFYDRLGLPYPWAGSSVARDDYLLVNLGQLKHVFSFALKFRTLGQGPVAIPAATLQAALDAWNALPAKPLGSTEDDLDGDGIPNLQEYLMGNALFDPLDLDGDRIPDTDEDARPGILSKLNSADAVWDKEAGGVVEYYDLDWNVSYQGDGVMNYEEVRLLGLDPAAPTTSTRTDGLTDVEVLVWTLNAGAPLNADPLRTFWEGIDADWIDANLWDYYLYWLDEGDANNDGEPDGLTAFRADVLAPLDPAWQPSNPGVGMVQAPSPVSFYDPVTMSSVLMDWDEDGVADTDRDGDGLPDLWEYRYEFNLRDAEDAGDDSDNDGLTNLEEYHLGTNPRLADTDGDGFDDHSESIEGDPLVASIVPTLSLSLVGLSHQYIFPGQTTPALAVKVTQGVLPVAGVTVVFDLSATAGSLLTAMHLAASPGSQMSVTTGADGVAAVTYAAGSEPGSASITASTPSVAGAVEFGVTVVPVPQPFGASGSGGGGGTYGDAAPARSTAAGAVATAANVEDGFRIRVKQKDGAPAGPVPYVDQPPQYLPPSGFTAGPLGRVGYSDFISPHRSWQWHTQLDFEPLPTSGPFKKTAPPTGSREYLVLVYQAEDVDGAERVPKYTGTLRFQYTDKGGRQITLIGNIPEKFVKVQSSGDSQSVKFEPPPASKGEERVHTVLLPVEFKMGFNDDEPITRLSTGEEVDPDQKTYILGSAVPEAERFGMVVYRGGLDMNIFFSAKFALPTSNGTATMDVKVKRMGEVIASQSNVATLQQGENLVTVDTLSIPCASVIGAGPTSNDEALEIIATVHQGSQSYDLPLGKVEYELFVTEENPTASVIFDKALELFDDAYDLVQVGSLSSISEALASVIDDRFTYFAGKEDSLDAKARFEAKSLMCLDHVKVMQDIFGSMGMDEGKRIAMWGGRLDPSERNMVYDDWWVFLDNKCSIKHAGGGDEVDPTNAEYTVHALLLIDGHYCDPAYGATYPDAVAAKAKGTALWNFYKPKDPGVVVRIEDEINYHNSTWVERERDGP